MPIIHDNEYDSSTDYENAFLPKCPECGEGRREDEINNFHGICNDCIEDLREKKEMDEK